MGRRYGAGIGGSRGDGVTPSGDGGGVPRPISRPLRPFSHGTRIAKVLVTMMSEKSVSGSWWRATVRGSVAAGLVGAAALATAAGIEVARAWTTRPQAGAEIGHVVGGAVVALFVVASVLLAARARSFTGVIVAASFALLAHGGVLTLEGQTIGAMFLGLAPIVFVLTSLALATPRAGGEVIELRDEPEKVSLDAAPDATLVAEWFAKTTPALMMRPTSATPFNAVPAIRLPAARRATTSRSTARGVGPVASPSRRAMLA